MSDVINLFDFYKEFPNEQACRDYLEKARWGSEIVCPKCGVIGNVYRYSNGRLYKCGACRKQFTVRVGTIFEDSKIPLQKWFLAIYLATSLKKGISSIQLSKYLGITQKSAWFMLHRIRLVFDDDTDTKLQGTVEVDETYVGGSNKNRHADKRRKPTDDGKSVVFGMVERSGRAFLRHVPHSGTEALTPYIEAHISKNARVYHDEHGVYAKLHTFGYNHAGVVHQRRQYRNGDVHTQNIENVWSHLKRGIVGVYHHVSGKHLQRYCDEFQYRYNTRELSDFERFEDWFGGIGKRIMYKELIT